MGKDMALAPDIAQQTEHNLDQLGSSNKAQFTTPDRTHVHTQQWWL